MATTEVTIDDIGRVRIFRRKGLKNIRITIAYDGIIRLSVPWYIPKSVGINYLRSKKEWIKKHHNPANSRSWEDGQDITEGHILKIHHYEKKKVTSKLSGTTLNVFLPAGQEKSRTQDSIKKCIKKFLKSKSEKELLPMFNDLAKKNGFEVKEIRFKNFKTRWGSCSQDKIISLNVCLIRLPGRLAEYVMIHELAHTRHLNHSPRFWQEVGIMMPDYKERRKELRKFNPALIL